MQVMGKNKVLVKVHPEGKYVVDLDKSIDVTQVTAGARVALKNDSYTLHLLLPTKANPCKSLGLGTPREVSCEPASKRW
jgi:26S proteasome regulatory subunit T6